MTATLSRLATPKWRTFQQSLARTLGLGIVVLFSDGTPSITFGAEHLALWTTSSPALAVAYRSFFHSMIGSGGDPKRVFVDPLGLPTTCFRLGPDAIVGLGGLPEASSGSVHGDLLGRLAAYGITPSEQELGALRTTTLLELTDKTEGVRVLYEQLRHTINETSDLGSRSLALAARDQINNLVLSSLDPEGFDLGKVLDLAASSLVILMDVQGAWALASQKPAHLTMVSRGGPAAQLEAIKETWRQAAATGDDPTIAVQEAFKHWDADLSVAPRALYYSSKSNWLSIGVLCSAGAAAGKGDAQILEDLLSPLAISCELASLYSALRRQVGTVLNAMRHPVVVVDPDGRVGVANRVATALLRDLGVELKLGHPIYGCGLGLALEDAVREAIRGTRVSREAEQYSNSVVLSWSVSPLIDDDERTAGAILVVEDVTEATMFHQRFVDWEKLNIAAQMAASLAHEIRSPLAAALGAIQLVQMPGGHAKRDEVLGRLHSELGRMNKTLTDYLTIARPKSHPQPKWVDVRLPLRELEFMLRGEARLHDVDLVISMTDEALPPVHGDPDSMKQVFLNLARNAFEAMPDGGRLDVTLRRDGNSVLVQFEDTGPGIPEHVRNHVFRPFFTTKVNGTGLGLAVSRTIVRGLGGDLTVEDTGGPGARATVKLPLSDSQQTSRLSADNGNLGYLQQAEDG